MADFCKDCSIETFGKDFGDMAGITTQENMAEGRSAVCLCEGCGVWIHVDPDGKKICNA